MPAFADGNAGTGGSESATNPTDCSTQIVGTCHGGGWVYVASTEDPVNVAGSSGDGYNFPGGTIYGCGTVGGYYRSSWFRNGNPGDLVGIAQNSQWATFGGPSAYNPAAMEIGGVQEAFNIALAAGVVPEGVNWGNVGWFCYSEKLKDKKAEVHAKAKVSVQTGPYDLSEESEEDGYVGVKISTDQDVVPVTFEHTFIFRPEDGYDFSSDHKAFSEAYKYGGKTAGESVAFKNKTWNSESGNEFQTVVEKHTVNVPVGEGKTVTACRTVKEYKTKLTFKYDGAVEYNTPNGTAKACIEITRPSDPGSPDSSDPVTVGGSFTGVLFAGEKASIGWNTSAQAVPTRRLKSFRAFSFLVSPDVGYSDSIVNGDRRYAVKVGGTTRIPCDYIVGKLGASNVVCSSYVQKSNGTVDSPYHAKVWDEIPLKKDRSHTYSGKSESVIVPEQFVGRSSIGAKYCTSLGYRFQYWYAVNKVGPSASQASHDDWHKIDNKDYWYIFNAACSPIAKRPSVSVWNGSVFTTGKINTSLSTRFEKTGFGTLESGGGSKQTFGSSVEYMAISNGTNIGFASGAALYRGSNATTVAKDSNSALTIANNANPLGIAQIEPNSTLGSRIESRILEGVTTTEQAESELGATLFAGTVVHKYKGNLKITGDIYSNSITAPLGSLPQMIIYVDGDVNITSNVSRIDAWLIATGTINTCAEFSASIGANSPTCSRQLRFNGPVSASSLKLNRTYGAELPPRVDGEGKYTPAEIFSFTPLTYVWAYEQSKKGNSSGSSTYNEVYSRELAPRY